MRCAVCTRTTTPTAGMHNRDKPRVNYAGEYNAYTVAYIVHMPGAWPAAS